MNRSLTVFLWMVAVLSLAASAQAFPQPSAYPVSWQLDFQHSQPKRLAVTPPGAQASQAYWYMTYTVTNNSKDERTFLPVFELMTEDGQVIRSDNKTPQAVLDAIRTVERNQYLEDVNQIAGTIRVGEDQAREGVVVWKEPSPEMGRFSIFVTGLSGEAVVLKNDQGEVITRKTDDGQKEPVVLRKTLHLQYHMLGDERFPGNDVVEKLAETWVMR